MHSIIKGKGRFPGENDSVNILEKVTLQSGTLVYERTAQEGPLTLSLGKNQIIKGLEYALLNMRESKKNSFVIPTKWIKPKDYPADTPRDSTLFYEVELIKIIRTKSKPPRK